MVKLLPLADVQAGVSPVRVGCNAPLLLLFLHKSTFNATLHLVSVLMLHFLIAAAHIKLLM